MNESTQRPGDRPIRSDQWQPPRGSRTVRADNNARHYAAESGVPGAHTQPSADSTVDALSDDRLRELIRERLTEDPALDAADVMLDVKDGRVTLTGSVNSERMRDVVEQCVENCGARAVLNRLDVRRA